MDVYKRLLKEETVRGERIAWIFRWILYAMLLVFANIVYFAEGNIAGYYGAFLALCALAYNGFLTPIILGKKRYPWIRFVSVTLDVVLLTLYNAVDTFSNSMLVPITTSTLILYPVLIFLAALRLDRALIIYATVLVILSMNGLFFTAWPRMDPKLTEVLISADINGQVYRSMYVLLCGLLMLFIPRMVERLLQAQKAVYDDSLAHFETARVDRLTGLANRLRLEEFLPQEISRASRAGTKLAVFYLDLDKFKPVNDTWGHDAGDIVLMEIGKRLASVVRDTDLAARVGGDEFILVLPSAGANDIHGIFVQRLNEILCKPIDIGKALVTVGASVGFAVYPDDAKDSASLIEFADKAMLRAKKN